MQLVHDRWPGGHPCHTKMKQIVHSYKKMGFPPCFLAALKQFSCKCAHCAKESGYAGTPSTCGTSWKRLGKFVSRPQCSITQVLLETDLGELQELSDNDLLTGLAKELHLILHTPSAWSTQRRGIACSLSWEVAASSGQLQV